MVIFNHEISRKQLLNLLVLVILIVGIPLGVFLTLQQQNLRSKADVADKTHLDIFGPGVSGGVAASRNVFIRLTYFASPSPAPSSSPSQSSSTEPVTTCKGETKTWAQLDSELKGAGYDGAYNHSQSELDAYNRAACPNGPILPEPVTTCKGETQTWAQLDLALHGANFPGPFDHTRAELTAYNSAACPDQPVNSTCLGTKSWNDIDAGLKKVNYGGQFNHTSQELNAFNTIMCPATSADAVKVTTCKGFAISWAQLDVELKGANYPGPFDHGSQELKAYNNAACPAQQTASSSGVLGTETSSTSALPSIRPFPNSNFPAHFRLANSQEGLANAPSQIFVTNGQVVPWQLTSGNGLKTVYAQFEVNGSWSDPVSATITLNEPVSSPIFQIGMNIETAPSYGYGDLRPASNKSDVDADLKEVARMGGTIVRVFAGNDKISNEEASKRLGDFLTAAQSYNISVIVSLIDFYGSGHNPQGTDSFYTGSYNGISLLNDNFFASGYKQDYKSFVETIVSENKNHSNIYAWEPGNELKDDASSQNFINFMKDITSTIKGIDPMHSVATGMLQASHAGLTPVQLYSNLPDVDIITIHPYGTSTDGTDDVTWAIQNGKKAIVEETGISGTGDRSGQMKQTIDYWQSKGASALLNWGFIAKGLGDNGDGDRSYGMDTIWHSADYEKYVDLFLSTVSVAQTTGQSCGQCIIGQNNQISPALQSQGWVTATTNINNVITNWCTSNQQACSIVRNGACNSVCQISGQNDNSNKLDETLKQLLEATSSASFIQQHNLKITNNLVPVKIVTLDPNFKLPAGTGTQGTTNGNVTDASVDLTKFSQITSDNSVVHVQFDGPTVTVAPGQSSSSSSSQTITQTSTQSQNSSTAPTSSPTSQPTTQPSAQPSSSPAGNTPLPEGAATYDLNNDGRVNSVDVALFLKDLVGNSSTTKEDFNGDGVVNAVDFGFLIKNLSL